MLSRRFRAELPLHLMLVPGIIIIFIFSYIPLYGLVIAFQNYNPAMGFSSPWVGTKNFSFLFSQPNFVRTIWNTLYIAIFKSILSVIVPVTFALLLNEINSKKNKRVFQTIIYMPHFLSWVILAGVLVDILAKDGLVNRALFLIGVSPINFLASEALFPWTMIITDTLKGFGFGTVIYLAALTGIDPTLYESAVIDGASRMKQTWYVTLPMLVPTIVLMVVLSLGNILNAGFDQIYNLYAPVVYKTGDIIDTYVFRLGLEQAQYSAATAVGLFKSSVSLILVALSQFLAYRFADYKIF